MTTHATRSWFLVLVVGCAVGCVPAPDGGSGLPSTDIWLVDITDRDGTPALGVPVNLTDRDGYDNQPAFLSDGSGFVYSSHDGEQADIWRYRFDDGATANLSGSPQNEYSPFSMPGDDGISAVRVEDDGDQRLWRFPVGAGEPQVIIEWEDEVEYYAWFDAELVALRVSGPPNALKFADPSIGWVEKHAVANSVGRAFGRIPGNNAFTYVHKVSAEESWVRQLDMLTRETFTVVQTLPDVEDFVWSPAGALLMADGSKVYRYRPATDDGWAEFADLANHGVSGISRLAIDAAGTRLLFVAERPAPVRGPTD